MAVSRVAVHTTPRLSYDVLFDGRPLLQEATLSLDVDGVRLGTTPRITGVERTRTDATVVPPVRQTAASLVDRHNDLRLLCAGGYAITFRAYDLGVAYRFETSLPRAEVKITGEEATFRFAADAPVYYPKEESFFSHNERQFKPVRLGELRAGRPRQHPGGRRDRRRSEGRHRRVGSGGLPRPLAARHRRPGADRDLPPLPARRRS